MLSKKKRVIKVASNSELVSKSYYRRLWLAVRNVRVSRRKWLNVISDAFLADDFHVIHPSGEPYPIPLVDDVFGDDLDMRWLSVFMLPDITGENPKHFSRKLERLRLIDLYFRVELPEIAAHFPK